MRQDRTGWVYGEETIGIVARIVTERGFAFVTVGETDYFLHKSDYADDFASLAEKQKVRFRPAQTPKGLRACEASRAR